MVIDDMGCLGCGRCMSIMSGGLDRWMSVCLVMSWLGENKIG